MSRTRAIDAEAPLYRAALSVLRANLGPCTGAALLLLGANIGSAYLDAPLAFAVARALVIMIIGYSAYRTLTSGGRVHGWRALATPEGRVPWRYAGIMVTILAPVLILGIVWNAPGGRIGPDSIGEIVFGLVMILLYGGLYVLLGTALPEVAATGEAHLGETLARGRRNYREIGRALVLGPWLFRTGALLVVVAMALAGLPADAVDMQGRFQPRGLVPMLFLTSAHVFAEILTAVVLTRVWQRSRASASPAPAARAVAQPIASRT